MGDLLILDIENHRSRSRIRDLGEVFTPEQYVHHLMDSIDSRHWSDEDIIFFEPTCGHGNIAVPILGRRIHSLRLKFHSNKVADPDLSAVATSLNRLWAVDISMENITLTRTRLLKVAMANLAPSRSLRSPQMRDFLGHVLCTLVWQVRENELLSGLSATRKIGELQSPTRLGRQWIKRNGVRTIDFSRDWCSRFCAEQSNKIVSHEYLRALRFLDSISGKPSIRGFDEFVFAVDILKEFVNSRTSGKSGVAA